MGPKALNAGLIGFGTVGSGVVQILQDRAGAIAARCGRSITLKCIADKDLESKRPVDLKHETLIPDAGQIFEDGEIDVVIELVGGTGIADRFVREALSRGKHVVTANKALLARNGESLFSLALENDRTIGFEASVMGAVPLLDLARRGLASGRIDRIEGVLNGTTNALLTQMERDGVSLVDAVKDAQAKGFAEADPSGDVDGHDAAHKITLLGAFALGCGLDLDAVARSGIGDVTVEQVQEVAARGRRLKLMATAVRNGTGAKLTVAPEELDRDDPVARLEGPDNGVWVEGEPFGRIFISGPGAGSLPTAGAVVSDLVSIASGDADATFPAWARWAIEKRGCG